LLDSNAEENEAVEEAKADDSVAEGAMVSDQSEPVHRACTNTSHTSQLPFCTVPQSYDPPRHPHSKNSFYAPWAVWFWWSLSLVSIGVCIYAIFRGAINSGFRIANTWGMHLPIVHSPNGSYPLTNTTFDPSDTNTPIFTNITFNGVFEDPKNDLVLYVFVFRNLLVFFASMFAIGFLQVVDIGHRFSQPFANMARSDTSATESLLLNYVWGTPGVVTFDALKNHHWRVAWFSSLNLISPLFPILVAGLFTITDTGSWIVFDIHKTSFYFVLAYLVLYTSTLPFAWPGRDRRLPRVFTSIADLMSLCYSSHVLRNPALDISRANVTQRHLDARLFLQEETYRVGLYTGSDHKTHFGFDTAYLRDDGSTVAHVSSLREWPSKLLNDRV
jgi:hypothetical protein